MKITGCRLVQAAALTAMCLALVALALPMSSAIGAPQAGKPCKQIGRTVTVDGWVYTCKKKGKQRAVWVRTPAPTPTPTPTPGPNDDEISSLAFARTQGAERPPDPNATGIGPWATQLNLAEGSALSLLGAPADIIDQAGVPNLLSLSDGRLLAYFVSWAQRNVMAVGIRDGGQWTFYRVAIAGFNAAPGGANGVDPSAVLLPDGSIRLYWMQPVGPQGSSQVHSATSKPGTALGVRFTHDPGTRLDPGTMVFDPTVALCGGQWSMWVNVNDTPTFATSTDGLAFTVTSTPPGLEGAFPWSAACLPDGSLQLLASKGSASGLPFVGTSAGYRANGSSLLPAGALADAALARMVDGTWALSYLSQMS